ncbi:enoyl-CoA hydratase/isomerase family protein [Variovorax saccharolyticus]|uniref:enoyl-CoA hydratase/isomerase family protein n=1 Tax=Variovorax saccharolyticus TaxID=3053516 RepID=UPI0025758143|nr:enoyl-CoA hydratase/isomerase family protein [Variovorax sp. J31P216]MDM0029547.1 enoyl-CoA hydratase/isomerase family protein [Variovorax sp. J31P216]
MSDILVDRSREGVAVVTINRPHRRNACDFEAWTDLKAAFADLDRDPKVRLAVLTGAGGAFCAGDDIVAFSAVRDDVERAEIYRKRIQEAYAAVQQAAFPVIAAISGVCVGGGCSLAMCCDFRVGDASARVGVPVAKLGLVYPTIQLQRLAWLIGASNARRWLFEAGIYDIEESYRVGFIDALTEGDVVEAALEFGRDMSARAPLSIAGSKAQMNAILAGHVDAQRQALDALVDEADKSEDFREAAAAFAAKRTPRFLGR